MRAIHTVAEAPAAIVPRSQVRSAPSTKQRESGCSAMNEYVGYVRWIRRSVSSEGVEPIFLTAKEAIAGRMPGTVEGPPYVSVSVAAATGTTGEAAGVGWERMDREEEDRNDERDCAEEEAEMHVQQNPLHGAIPH